MSPWCAYFKQTFHGWLAKGCSQAELFLWCWCHQTGSVQESWQNRLWIKTTNDVDTPKFVSSYRLQSVGTGWDLLKLGTHHAIFVGTMIVVRRDDGRRSSNDPLTPCDGCRLTAHTTRRPSAAHTMADNSWSRWRTWRIFDFLLMKIDLQSQATLLRPRKKLFKWNKKKH